MRADLHTHTFFSADGSGTPAQLFDVAREAGVELLAISEHNSCAHIAECLALASTQASIRFIPAVELSCTTANAGDAEVHLLCYFTDPSRPVWASPDFHALIARLADIQVENLSRISQAAGLASDDVDTVITMSRESGLIHRSAAPSYYHLKRHFDRLDGIVAKHTKTRLSEARSELKRAGRLVPYPNYCEFARLMAEPASLWVLAHPARYRWSPATLSTILRDMKSLGLAGVETNYYADMDNAPAFAALADHLGLNRTAGSDTHDFAGLRSEDYSRILDRIALPSDELRWLSSAFRDSPRS